MTFALPQGSVFPGIWRKRRAGAAWILLPRPPRPPPPPWLGRLAPPALCDSSQSGFSVRGQPGPEPTLDRGWLLLIPQDKDVH